MTDLIKPRTERLVVCIGTSPSNKNLVEAAKEMARQFNAQWFALHVEDPKSLMMSETGQQAAVESLRLAEQLGAETFTLAGRNIAEEILTFARQRNIAKIIVGKPRHSLWRSIFLRNPVDQLVRLSGEIDVYALTGEKKEHRDEPYTIHPQKIRLSDYGAGLLLFILATLLCFLMYPYFHLSNLIMVYLLGVMITATSCGRGPAILGSFLSVLAFDFFFVPPRFSITVEEAQYIVTFIVMFLVALVISHLANRLRQQVEVARYQERQASAMHGLSRQLASTRGMEKIFQVAVQYISEIFDCQCIAMVPNSQVRFNVIAGDPSSVFHHDVVKEIQIAHTAFNTGQMAGLGTQTSQASENLYVPIRAGDFTLGVLVLRPADRDRFRHPEQIYLLESLVKQIALALEVEHLAGSEKSKV